SDFLKTMAVMANRAEKGQAAQGTSGAVARRRLLGRQSCVARRASFLRPGLVGQMLGSLLERLNFVGVTGGVAHEHADRLVSADRYRHGLRDANTDHVSNGSPTQIVKS